jgi:hypothetical protein
VHCGNGRLAQALGVLDMKRRFLFTLLGMLVASSSFAAFPNEQLTQLSSITAGIAHSSSFVLYEGLPHQAWEREQLLEELGSKKFISMYGFPFYERPLSVAAADVEALRRLTSTPESYLPYGGPKLCGGFHPDYALAWKNGDTTFYILVCFGCREIKLYGADRELLTEMATESRPQFEMLLLKYHDQRPPHE